MSNLEQTTKVSTSDNSGDFNTNDISISTQITEEGTRIKSHYIHSLILLFTLMGLTSLIIFTVISINKATPLPIKNSETVNNEPNPVLPNDKNDDQEQKINGYSLNDNNKIYLLEDGSLFYTNIDKYSGTLIPNNRNTLGYISKGQESNLTELENPVLIYTSASRIYGIASYLLDESTSTIYISVIYNNYPSKSENEKNTIVQIDTKTFSTNEVWSNSMWFKVSRYEGLTGAVYIKKVIDNKFIVFDIFNCFHCSGFPTNTIILNLKTGKEKFYDGVIEKIEFDIENNMVTYKKTQTISEDCVVGMCIPTIETVGDRLEDTLP